MSIITQANIKVKSDGTTQGTRLYFVDGDEEKEITPVSAVTFSLDMENKLELTLTVPLGQIEAVVPAKLLKIIEKGRNAS